MAHAIAQKGSAPTTSPVESATPAKPASRLGNARMAAQVVARAADQADGTADLAATLALETSAPAKAVPEAKAEAAKAVPEASTSVRRDPGFDQIPEDGGTTAQPVAPVERKQQEAALPTLREKHRTDATVAYTDLKDGKPFVQPGEDKHAVEAHDVAQGALGDCYFVAGMAAVARANPDAIQDLIKDNGDGTFEVSLYVRKDRLSRPSKVTQTIDAQIPTKSGGAEVLYAESVDRDGEDRELWPSLLEKALAQHKGSYEDIQGSKIANGMAFGGATELLTGKAEGYRSTDGMSRDEILRVLSAALADNKPVTVDSREMSADPEMTKQANAMNVYGNHAYAVEAVDVEKGTIRLQNPWGSNHVETITPEQLKTFYRGVRVGA
jgi:hypothetical protein